MRGSVSWLPDYIGVFIYTSMGICHSSTVLSLKAALDEFISNKKLRGFKLHGKKMIHVLELGPKFLNNRSKCTVIVDV